jgi:LysR substrate binding domain
MAVPGVGLNGALRLATFERVSVRYWSVLAHRHRASRAVLQCLVALLHSVGSLRFLSVGMVAGTAPVIRRQVGATLDGEAYYQRCVSLIADVEDAERAFVGAKPSGLVRVDAHGTQARHFLLPGLPRFRQQYPDIRLHFSEAHQPLDMIREGFDCILGAGELSDSPLIKRRLALLEPGTFASPDYLGRFGTPQTPDDLAGHEMVGCYRATAATSCR